MADETQSTTQAASTSASSAANTVSVGSSTPAENTVQVQAPVTHPGEEAIKVLLAQYADIENKPGLDSSVYANGLVAFSKAVNLIIRSKATWAYELLWDFFVEHQNDAVREQEGLKGIDTVAIDTTRIAAVFNLFRFKTTGISLPPQPDYYISAVGDLDIVLWVYNHQ